MTTMALDLHDHDKARSTLDASIDSASRVITHLIGSDHFDISQLRNAPAARAPVAVDPAPRARATDTPTEKKSP